MNRLSRAAIVVTALVAIASPAVVAQDAADLEDRCRANAPTEEEVAICVNVVRRYLTEVPAASTDPGDDPSQSGSSFTIDDAYIVTLVEHEWRWPSDNQFVEPDPGNMFVTVLARFDGLSDEGSSYGPAFFKVFDQDGFEYDMELLGREPGLGFGDVQAGRSVQGWVTFEVPESTSGLSLSYSGTMFFDGEDARWDIAP